MSEWILYEMGVHPYRVVLPKGLPLDGIGWKG